ncbi:hypothetical protein IWW50_006902 [Coemansia erecta]|nr:hypothetical protein IWW50_006902 [Coemansia erecta]
MDTVAENTYDETANASLMEDEQPEVVDAELEELRRVRRALSKMNQGIENVQHQMKYFNSNVSQTTQLLDIWVRVLSQTVHNQGFLQNEEWQGGSMDTAKLNDIIQRDIQRQEEAERQAREAELQREQEIAEAREREKKRAEHALAVENAARQAPKVRPGAMPGRRPPPGPGAATRGRGAIGARRGGASSSTRGRGRGRGTSIPTATGSRIRPPH